MSKITGTVKWFNNKKGFGFISPTSANSPTEDEIFVHQTSIFSDGAYRTLVEGAEVEFEVDKEQESGKWKAINVTAPGGGSLKPPPREPRRGGSGGGGGAGPRKPRTANNENDHNEEKEDENDKENGDKQGPRPSGPRGGGGGRGPRRNPMKSEGDQNGSTPAPRRDPPFHEVISEEAKKKIVNAGLDLGNKGTIDVALGDARIKLGQGGYAACALASGTIGEGTFTCDEKGLVTFNWERCLSYADDDWKVTDTSGLLATLALDQEGIGTVKADETAESLWGAGKKDPKDAFEQNGFKMKRVVLTRPPNRGRRVWNNNRKK